MHTDESPSDYRYEWKTSSLFSYSTIKVDFIIRSSRTTTYYKCIFKKDVDYEVEVAFRPIRFRPISGGTGGETTNVDSSTLSFCSEHARSHAIETI